MFHLAVVFEKGDLVGGGFDAQHPAKLVIDFDRSTAHAMLYASALNASRQSTADFLG